MQVIIVGCGKVGRNLAEQLQAEDIDITLVDVIADKINDLCENIDAMGIVGNGASINTLMEAGVDTADILIAVTASDELNLLCCLIAQKANHCQTIARVRNPIYEKEIGFIKERLGVTMIINPELAAAQEISRLLRFPSAIKIDTFARGRVELLKFKVLPEFKLDGMSVSQISDAFRSDILVCAIESRDNVSIPGGDHIIHDGDMVSILASPLNAAAFFRKIGLKTNQVKNCIIVGGGTISYYLAHALLGMKISVKIIEQNHERCVELAELLPSAVIIEADGSRQDILAAEGISSTDAVITLTNMDEENLIISMYASHIGVPKVITKVNRTEYVEAFKSMGIDTFISPKALCSTDIVRYVRAMQNTTGGSVITLHRMVEGKAEALEFRAAETTRHLGETLLDIQLKPEILIACITHKGRTIIPRGSDVFQAGDTVIVVTTSGQPINDLNDIFAD